MSHAMKVKFWGVRGSYPTPGAGTVEFGGNTACVQVSAGGQTIILDAGTGLIDLGRTLAAEARLRGSSVEVVLLFSHFHHDHLLGFPFFAPAYHPLARLHLVGPELFAQNVEAVLARNQVPPLFPVTLQDMAAVKNIHTVQDRDTLLWRGGAAPRKLSDSSQSSLLLEDAILIRVLRSYAHPGGVLCYRIEFGGQAVVYATDTEGYIGTDRRLVAFAQGADLLIHDAQYSEDHYYGQRPGVPSTQGFGHSTARMACEVAAAAGVGRLVLFHHDPGYDDEALRRIERESQGWFSQVVAAREGQEIELARESQRAGCQGESVAAHAVTSASAVS
jgi:phosphoribosyl 1,2-cyclic phosphodiesterase